MISHLRRKHMSRREQAAVQLALTLSDDETPQGSPPSLEELALLSEGRLIKQQGRQRYDEVLSHLHADNQLLARWLEVAELQEPEPTQRNEPLAFIRSFFDFRISAAIGAAAVLMVGFFLIPRPAEHGMEPSPARMAAPYAESADWVVQASLAAGAINALEDLPEAERALLLEEDAQISIPSTPYPEHPVAHEYGAMLTEAQLHCRRDEPLSTGLTQRLHALQNALDFPIDADCSTLTRQWQQAVR